jgi:hypothetical protein
MPSADHFVDAVHRRWVIVHAFEQIGRGILLASALAIALLLVAVWQSLPTGPILLCSCIFGVFLGVFLALLQKPTRLAAAVEADRQLNFDDLLISAIYVSARTDPEFQAILKSIADARCAQHSPSEVLLRRFGIHNWSGIALTLSIAVTLAVIPMQPTRSQAVDANLSVLSASPTIAGQTSQADRGFVPVVNDPMSDGSSSTAMSDAKSDTHPGSGAQPAQSLGTSNAGNASGTGGGRSATASTPEHDQLPNQSAGRSLNQTGTEASGGAISARKNETGNSPAGSTVSSATPTGPVPAWSGDATGTSPDLGSSTLDRIPSEDRDLVRDFFRR